MGALLDAAVVEAAPPGDLVCKRGRRWRTLWKGGAESRRPSGRVGRRLRRVTREGGQRLVSAAVPITLPLEVLKCTHGNFPQATGIMGERARGDMTREHPVRGTLRDGLGPGVEVRPVPELQRF
jgi:hypothetical protein